MLLPCIILNANQRIKNREGLGMRLHLMNFSQWQGYTLISYVRCRGDKKMGTARKRQSDGWPYLYCFYDLNTVSLHAAVFKMVDMSNHN